MIRRPHFPRALLTCLALALLLLPSCTAVKTAWQKASNRNMVHRIAPALVGTEWIHPPGIVPTHEYEGRWTLLVFFDPAEAKTAARLAEVCEAQERYLHDGVVALGITEADRERTTFFLEKHPTPISIVAAARADRIAFGIKNLYEPVVYLVDPYQRIVTYGLDPALALLQKKHGH